MMAPGFEMVVSQNPLHRGGGDVPNEAICDELVRQFVAIPLGQATTQRIRSLEGQTHHVDGHICGENCPWRRGQGQR